MDNSSEIGILHYTYVVVDENDESLDINKLPKKAIH